LAALGIAPLAQRQISQLSGGQQQRAFFARALCQQAQLIVLDEPFVGVDAASEQLMLAQIRQFAQQGAIVLWVEHNPLLLPGTAHQVLYLNGTLQGVFTSPENYLATLQPQPRPLPQPPVPNPN
jgi:ABC-type Mn2+/Zn2+ transport system ATPase subunit